MRQIILLNRRLTYSEQSLIDRVLSLLNSKMIEHWKASEPELLEEALELMEGEEEVKQHG